MEAVAEPVAPAEEIPVETPPKVKKAKPAAKNPVVKKVAEHPSYDEMVLATLADLKLAERKVGYSYRSILAHMSAKYGLAPSGNTRNSVKNSITKLIEKEVVMVKLTDVYVK